MFFRNVSRAEWLVLVLFIALGIASRFFLADIPNFKPVAAMVLFGGFFFRNAMLPVFGVISVMVLSDMVLGVYSWPLMISVYVSLALAIVLGRKIRQRQGAELRGWWWPISFFGASLAMSTVFYLLTNGVVWIIGGEGFYPMTLAGLIECYVAAVPFYRATMVSDLVFTSVFVGSYALAIRFSDSAAKRGDKGTQLA